MRSKAFTDRIGINRKIAAVNITLLTNVFIWYFYVSNFIMQLTNDLIILGINVAGIATAALLSSTLINRIRNRLAFLKYWTLVGIVLSLTPLVIDVTTYTGLTTVSLILGVYFGIGMPICMGYYAATTEIGNRARLGGITFLLIGAGFSLLSFIGTNSVLISVIILAAWRAVGLLTLIILKPAEIPVNEKEKTSYRSVIFNKHFLLYFAPWFMFSLVNYLVVPVNQKFFPSSVVDASGIIENILAGITAVIGGFFADLLGRKRLTVAGFALLGMGYAILGLMPGNLGAWWFYACVDGVAWGTFAMIFILTIWGDLAQDKSSEKYYAIGGLPFLFSSFLRLSLGVYVASNIEDGFAIFSFASVFLFLAVLPLFYAPETLPEKVMKTRDLQSYVEKAKQKAQKEAEKSQKQHSDKAEEENEKAKEEPEETPEDAEARKLAEKYY